MTTPVAGLFGLATVFCGLIAPVFLSPLFRYTGVREMKRRDFLKLAGTYPLLATMSRSGFSAEKPRKIPDKIEGSWFEFQHHSLHEGRDWNGTLEKFTAEQWDEKVREIAETGMEYLVLLNVAIYGKSFFPSKVLPKHELGCEDPLEVVLKAADKYGIKFFVSNDFYGNWVDSLEMMQDKEVSRRRIQAMDEIVEKYAHHKSFYGWYFPNEIGIDKIFSEIFIEYVKECSEHARKLTPDLKRLIAPYGTRHVEEGDQFVRQLDRIDVDFVAYQDEIGVQKTKIEESAAIFERLHRLHKKSGRSALWADVEVFRFEAQVYRSALLPAPGEEVIRQLQAVAPFVEKILIYQYPGLMNAPGTQSFAGKPESLELYKSLEKAGWIGKPSS